MPVTFRAATCLAGLPAALLASLLASQAASAHGGGLNAEGCHHDRSNGGYHCHRAPAARPAMANPSLVRPQDGALSRPDSDDVRYRNCAAARAAGAAPVRRGDPGYAAHLDRDNDGVGCE